LSVPDEQSLQILLEKIRWRKLVHSIFREPDIGDELTAIAVEPSEKAKKLCSRLPLALEEVKLNS
jgi:hypothetical protein